MKQLKWTPVFLLQAILNSLLHFRELYVIYSAVIGDIQEAVRTGTLHEPKFRRRIFDKFWTAIEEITARWRVQ